MDELIRLEIENRALWNVINEARRILEDPCTHHTTKEKRARSLLNRTGYYINRSSREGQADEFQSQKSKKRFLEEIKTLTGADK